MVRLIHSCRGLTGDCLAHGGILHLEKAPRQPLAGAIMAILIAANAPLSTPQIHERLPAHGILVSQNTVSRSVRTLLRRGDVLMECHGNRRCRHRRKYLAKVICR